MNFQFTTDTVIAGLALIMGVIALIDSRKNARKLAQPHIVGGRSMNWTKDGLTFTYEISNHGGGPAHITRFILFLNKKEFTAPVGKDPIRTLIDEGLAGKLPHPCHSRGECSQVGRGQMQPL